MLRAIALSLALLISLGAIIPLATDYTEAGPKYSYKKKKKKKKKLKKYSRAWWKWYRAKIKRQKAVAARKRALRIKRILAARARKEQAAMETPESATQKAVLSKTGLPKLVKTADRTPKSKQRVAAGESNEAAVLPTGDMAPQGWKRDKGNFSYRVDDEGGRQIGSAAISEVGTSMGADAGGAKSKTIGGVPMSALRRTVIDKMVREEGWVVNDYQKEVNGKKVYVVVAQSPAQGGGVQSRIFYFTEVDGRIVSIATNAPSNSAERIAQDSERVINTLHRKVQQAELKK